MTLLEREKRRSELLQTATVLLAGTIAGMQTRDSGDKHRVRMARDLISEVDAVVACEYAASVSKELG